MAAAWVVLAPELAIARQLTVQYAAGTPIDAKSEVISGSNPSVRVVSVPAAEGNYRVTLEITGRGTLTVKAEDRRLVLPPLQLRRGERITRSFVVNIRRPTLPTPPANAPGGDSVLLPDADLHSLTWDANLSIELIGDATVRGIRVEPVQVPTLYLAGDSTVTDQPYEPAASWGQMLPALLDDQVAVANHARSGATLKSFVTDLRLAKILSTIRPGDWLFIQFGHNDQKANWPQTYADPKLVYPAWLRVYIAEARARGARPVLVTSPERRTFEGSRIRSTLAEHVAAMKRVAAEEQVPLIDLNAASRRIYEALGPERAPLAFNDGGRDATHHNNYGAWLMANAVAGELRKRVPELAGHIVAPPFDPSRPSPPGRFQVPASAAHSVARPDGN